MRQLLLCASVGLTVMVTDAAAQSTGPAGSGQPHDNIQPSLVLNALIRTDGSVFEKLGEIKYFAGNFAPAGYHFADGQVLDVDDYNPLWGRMGAIYGGNGSTTFALPDLRGRAAMHYGEGPDLTPVALTQTGGAANVTLTTAQLPVHTHSAGVIGPTGPAGGGLPHPNQQPCLAVNYRIDLDGSFPEPGTGGSGIADDFLADIEISAIPTGEFDHLGSANGQLMPINQNQALYRILGTTYGGNGFTNFALPDLRGRLPVGQGAGPGLTNRPLGSSFGEETHTLTLDEMPAHTHTLPGGGATDSAGGGLPHNEMQPSLALSYIIAINGINPTLGSSPDNSPFMGEVSLFAGSFAPAGWALAEGQILSIVDHPVLYNLLGTTYGGDGVSTFALPDLRGRTIIHTMGTAYELGDILGAEQHALLESEIPTHTHSVVPEPAAGILCLIAALTMTVRRTPRRSANEGDRRR